MLATLLTALAQSTSDLGDDVATVAGEGDPEAQAKNLKALDGVGAAAADKIVEYLATGTIAEHAELAQNVPQGLMALLGL